MEREGTPTTEDLWTLIQEQRAEMGAQQRRVAELEAREQQRAAELRSRSGGQRGGGMSRGMARGLMVALSLLLVTVMTGSAYAGVPARHLATGPVPQGGWYLRWNGSRWVADHIQPGDVPPSLNPVQIATLRWYEASQTGSQFPVGRNPAEVAFDGSSVWVTNYTSNTVTKLRASDGSVLGTYTVGNGPEGVAFDGSSVWVADNFSSTVTKLRASDGSVLGTYAVGNAPYGVAFDGSSVWVANTGSNTVTKLRASDGSVLGTYAVGNGPLGVAFDGSSVWVTNFDSNTVTKL